MAPGVFRARNLASGQRSASRVANRYPREFRDPQRPAILAPYLVLFFGSILLMGSPMYRCSRPRWALTAATSALLFAAMVYALARGVG